MIEETKLVEMENRVAKATPGPWIRSGVRQKLNGEDCICIGPERFWIIALPIGKMGKEQAKALIDGDFIAHARSDLPTLLTELRRLQADNAALRKALEPFAEYATGVNQLPRDLVITSGSPIARRQLRLADCFAARTALEKQG